MAAKGRPIWEVVDLWYAAAFANRPWSDPLRATADLLGGAGSAFFDLDRRNGQIGHFDVHRLERGAGEYVERMNRINPRMQYSIRQPGPHIVTDYNILTESALSRNEFYDWMERTNDTRYFVGGRLVDCGARSLFASVEFSRRHGHPDEAAVKSFRLLASHIANAWRISTLVQAVNESAITTQLMARQLPFGVIGLRRDGAVLFMNEAAEGVVACADGLTIVDGRLHAAIAASDSPLQDAIARLIPSVADQLPGHSHVLTVARPSGQAPFVLRLLPCGRYTSFVAVELPAVLVLIANPSQQAVPAEATLRSLNFTPAEIRLVQQIARGRTLAQAANDLGMSHNTGRAHLRSVFAKAKVRSQIELVRVLSELARLEQS
ncbi:MAG: helix-turn-helix transcriptional regulator [Hyphomicrobiaceae bacterium]